MLLPLLLLLLLLLQHRNCQMGHQQHQLSLYAVSFADRIVEYKPGAPGLELPDAELRNLPQIAKVRFASACFAWSHFVDCMLVSKRCKV